MNCFEYLKVTDWHSEYDSVNKPLRYLETCRIDSTMTKEDILESIYPSQGASDCRVRIKKIKEQTTPEKPRKAGPDIRYCALLEIAALMSTRNKKRILPI